MFRLPSIIALTALILTPLCHSFPSFPLRRDTSPSAARIQSELGPKLCKGSSIYFPSSPEFADLTERWSARVEGDILVVVVPACENDVALAVKFANLVDIPFLAITRGHGTPLQLANIKNGLLIKMTKLDSIEVNADGKSATLGGGVYTDLLLAKLAEKNKVAATGSCGCVGIVGPGLGGGFGKYMGYSGLISDNFLELSLVTADGSQITASPTSNSELFWGLRGAGHNYGIVTKFKYKVFDYPKGQNTYFTTYFFSGQQLEAFFTQLNKLLDNGKLPKDANTYAVLLNNPAIDSKPVILFQFYYFGTADQALSYLQPFLDLKPLSVSNSTVLYKNLAHEATGTGVGDPTCLGGTTKSFFNVGLKTYNVASNREIYDLFSSMTTATPALASSFVQFEAYAVQGLKAVDPASTAYAHRDDNILVSFTTDYKPSADTDALAAKYGKQARQIWLDGQKGRPYNSYANYAYGDETPQQIYGYDGGRVDRLKVLKKKWDPKGRFNFYNPILV